MKALRLCAFGFAVVALGLALILASTSAGEVATFDCGSMLNPSDAGDGPPIPVGALNGDLVEPKCDKKIAGRRNRVIGLVLVGVVAAMGGLALGRRTRRETPQPIPSTSV